MLSDILSVSEIIYQLPIMASLGVVGCLLSDINLNPKPDNSAEQRFLRQIASEESSER